MNLNEALLLLIASTLIIYFVWNYKNAKSNPHRQNNNDMRYYELKSKYEFLVAIVSFVVIVISYLGYTTFNSVKEDIEKEVNNDIKPYKDSLKIVSDSVRLLQKQFEMANEGLRVFHNTMDTMTFKQSNLMSSFGKSKNLLVNLKGEVKNISESNALKRQFYVMQDLLIHYNRDINTYKIKFADLRTNNGEKLPSFTEPPLLLVNPKNGATLLTFNITKDGFEALVGTIASIEDNPSNNYYFQLVIYN